MKQEAYKSVEAFNNGSASSSELGGFFILLGVVFFIGMSGTSILGFSPWTLIALLPVYWIGMAAYKRYRQQGRVTRQVFLMLVFSLLPFTYIAAAGLGLNVAGIWPVGLIALGISYLIFGLDK